MDGDVDSEVLRREVRRLEKRLAAIQKEEYVPDASAKVAVNRRTRQTLGLLRVGVVRREGLDRLGLQVVSEEGRPLRPIQWCRRSWLRPVLRQEFVFAPLETTRCWLVATTGDAVGRVSLGPLRSHVRYDKVIEVAGGHVYATLRFDYSRADDVRRQIDALRGRDSDSEEEEEEEEEEPEEKEVAREEAAGGEPRVKPSAELERLMAARRAACVELERLERRKPNETYDAKAGVSIDATNRPLGRLDIRVVGLSRLAAEELRIAAAVRRQSNVAQLPALAAFLEKHPDPAAVSPPFRDHVHLVLAPVPTLRATLQLDLLALRKEKWTRLATLDPRCPLDDFKHQRPTKRRFALRPILDDPAATAAKAYHWPRPDSSPPPGDAIFLDLVLHLTRSNLLPILHETARVAKRRHQLERDIASLVLKQRDSSSSSSSSRPHS